MPAIWSLASKAFTPEQLAELYDINVLSTQRVNAQPCLSCASRRMVCWCGVQPAVPRENSAVSGPITSPEGGHGCLAVVYARELTRWGVETSIIVPGAFTGGTNHFANAGSPSDKERVAEYEAGPYKGFADDIMKVSRRLYS